MYSSDPLHSVHYDGDIFLPGMAVSFSLSRSLIDKEQLDFSRASADTTVVENLQQPNGVDACAFFLGSYWSHNSPCKLELLY